MSIYYYLPVSFANVANRGPNWIHGTSNNPIVQLANETKTPLASMADNACVYSSQGLPMSSEEVSAGLDKVWSLIADAFKHSNEHCLTIPSDLSLKDFFRERLLEESMDSEEQNRIMLLAETWGSFIGDPWEKQSLKWFWLEECLDGGEFSCTPTSSRFYTEIYRNDA